uniref:Uncharacterized protein n=1 Tax=Kwoniella bestiolae CBS 10118 TaxID=1296100 RepID=A0A1B9FZS6_9TREE|nr:hypothetical protein I302_05728 [Kwoniella bestiolae CBS 10118]OCF24269.1 hypothetical protein I302_05728 [Kwoniella bestiolae CBS 10118]
MNAFHNSAFAVFFDWSQCHQRTEKRDRESIPKSRVSQQSWLLRTFHYSSGLGTGSFIHSVTPTKSPLSVPTANQASQFKLQEIEDAAVKFYLPFDASPGISHEATFKREIPCTLNVTRLSISLGGLGLSWKTNSSRKIQGTLETDLRVYFRTWDKPTQVDLGKNPAISHSTREIKSLDRSLRSTTKASIDWDKA